MSRMSRTRRRSKYSLISCAIFSSAIFAVPNVSTLTDSGSPHRLRKHLNFDAIRQPCGDNILRNITRRIRRGAIHFGWVFALNAPPPCRPMPPYDVDDESCVRSRRIAHRTANHKSSSRVDKILRSLSTISFGMDGWITFQLLAR